VSHPYEGRRVRAIAVPIDRSRIPRDVVDELSGMQSRAGQGKSVLLVRAVWSAKQGDVCDIEECEKLRVSRNGKIVGLNPRQCAMHVPIECVEVADDWSTA
jgi:hypothetical protein